MDLRGRTLSHYRVEEEISRGGMGVVYRATDTRLHRDVALKVLPEDLTYDADRRRRFIQEAQAASSIEHPNVAVIYDVDEADGQTFIAMELIRGLKMSEWLQRHRPAVAQTLDLAGEIAAGLARAHERQIIHRDLKPANVMVTEDGHAKIIDFGIAKLMETTAPSNAETRASQDTPTAAGVVLGTMTYMSPEQARGDKVDHRSDIFAFGIVLHEMLSGSPPFQGKTSLETAAAILHAVAPRLPPLGHGIAPEAGADLQRIVDKCLAKDPVDRYQGMKDVGVDLRAARRRLESGAQTVAAPAVAPRRRPMPIVIAGALVVVGAIGIFVWRGRSSSGPLESTETGRKPSVAVLYFDNSTGTTDLDWLRTGITEMVVTDLSQSPDLEVVGTDRLYSALAALKRADDKVLSADVVSQIAQRIGVDHVIVGSYMKAGEAVRINLRLQNVKSGRIVTSERVEGPGTSSLFQMVDDLSRRIRTKFEELRPAGGRGPEPILSAPGAAAGAKHEGLDRGLGDVTTTSIEAYRQYAEGVNMHERFREAEAAALFEKAIAIDPSFAMAYVKLAVATNNVGRIDLRDKYAALALQHADRLTPRERYYIEGFYYSQKNDSIARGLDAYKKCVDLDPGHEACRHNLALGLTLLERYQEAAGHYEELIARGVTNPTAYSNLAAIYLRLGQPDKAVASTESFSKRNPESGGGHRGVGLALIGQGRYEDAIQELSKAERLEPTDTVTPMARGMAQVAREDWDAARSSAAALTSTENQTRRWNGNLLQATLEMYRGRCVDALAAVERAETAYKVPTARTASAFILGAEVQLACGQPAGALASARKAVPPAKGDSVERDALAAVAWAAAATGRTKDSDEALAALAALADPLAPARDARGLAYARGRAALERKDYSTAIAELERAQAALPPRGSVLPPPEHVRMWFALGEAYVGANRPKDAERWFQRVADSGQEHVLQPMSFVRSFYYLGKIREQAGDLPRAREAYRRFVGYWKDGTIDRDRVAEADRRVRGQ